AQFGRTGDQLFRMRSPCQKRKVRYAVKLGVGVGGGESRMHGRRCSVACLAEQAVKKPAAGLGLTLAIKPVACTLWILGNEVIALVMSRGIPPAAFQPFWPLYESQ